MKIKHFRPAVANDRNYHSLLLYPETKEEQQLVQRLDDCQLLAGCGRDPQSGDYIHATIAISDPRGTK